MEGTVEQKSGKGGLSLPICKVEHQSSASGLELTPPVLLVFRPSVSDWSYAIGSPGSPAYRQKTMRLLSLYIHGFIS